MSSTKKKVPKAAVRTKQTDSPPVVTLRPSSTNRTTVATIKRLPATNTTTATTKSASVVKSVVRVKSVGKRPPSALLVQTSNKRMRMAVVDTPTLISSTVAPKTVTKKKSDVQTLVSSITFAPVTHVKETPVVLGREAQQVVEWLNGKHGHLLGKETAPRCSKYERAHMLGIRAGQVSAGTPPTIAIHGETDPIRIAQAEMQEGTVPLAIRRYLPKGSFQDWQIEQLQ